MSDAAHSSVVELAIDQTGDGPPIVFTHGWADTRAVWSGVIEALDEDARCINWDLRGHGDSEVVPPGQYSREHALADLERVVDLADGPAILAGHSLGGYLSLAFALRRPERVAGLLLVAAGPGFRKKDAMDSWNASVERSATELGVPEGQEEISKHVDAWVIDSLGDITCPVVTIIGERDKRFAASVGVFRKNLDVRQSVTVVDAGHMVHLKQPEAVADAARSLIAEIA